MSYYATCLGCDLRISKENAKKMEADGLNWRTLAADANLSMDFDGSFHTLWYEDSCKYGDWVETGLQTMAPYLENGWILWMGEDFDGLWGYTFKDGVAEERSRHFNPCEYLGMEI